MSSQPFQVNRVILVAEVTQQVTYQGERIVFGVSDALGNTLPVYVFKETLVRSYGDKINVGDWVHIEGSLAVDAETETVYVAVNSDAYSTLEYKSKASVETSRDAQERLHVEAVGQTSTQMEEMSSGEPPPEEPAPRASEPSRQEATARVPATPLRPHAPSVAAPAVTSPQPNGQSPIRRPGMRPGVPSPSPTAAQPRPMGRPGVVTPAPAARSEPDQAYDYDPSDPTDIPF